MANATCRTCPLWQPSDQGSGYCHHISVIHSQDSGISGEGWCSEHPLRQRDRLAAAALPAVIAGLPAEEWSAPKAIARDAYDIADAMLALAAEKEVK